MIDLWTCTISGCTFIGHFDRFVFSEKEALRKTGPRLQPTEIHIHANALQLGSNNELNYSHEAGNAIPPDEEATEYVLEDDIGAVQIGENNRKTVNREDDYDDVDTKVPTNDLSTDQRNDKAQIAKYGEPNRYLQESIWVCAQPMRDDVTL